MSVINATPLLAAAGGDYQISRSVRLRSSASAYFNRTPASASNRTTWTWSAWVKRGTLGSYASLFSAYDGTSNNDGIAFDANNKLQLYSSNGAATFRLSTAVYRDTASWYHIVVTSDTTNATAQSRAKVWVNGSEITAWDTNATITQNLNWNGYNTTNQHNIGRYVAGGYYDGYQTEVNFIDGQALTPSSFGETDAITGVWKPKKYAGTYGTNGFYLNFSENSSNTATTIGKDNSGNGNNWTPNNISVTAGVTYDSMLDVPTLYADGGNGRGNYAVWSKVDTNSGGTTIWNANISNNDAGSDVQLRSTIAVNSGKWYYEWTFQSAGTGAAYSHIGLATADSPLIAAYLGSTATSWSIFTFDGKKRNNGSYVTYGSGVSANDVIMCAFDVDAGKVWWGKNGTWFASGDPAAGSNAAFTNLAGTIAASCTPRDISHVNFGQRPFAYTPPTGFKALNTQNLPAPTILKGNQYFDVTLWSGNNTSPRTLTNSSAMQPDLVWLKKRGADNHKLYDSIRGAGNNTELESNTTVAEGGSNSDVYGYLSAFTSAGFTVSGGTDPTFPNGLVNGSGENYVAWQWKANGSAVTNTSGSITSQVNAGTSQGFSVVTYTGTGANATVGHGLGVAPRFIIVKRRNSGQNWFVGSGAFPSWSYALEGLNTTAAANSGATAVWNATAPTSSVFSIGADLSASGGTYVAYCFSEVAGFSKFGSYTGNGSADGPFIFTGFRPRYVMIKRTDSTGDWFVFDTARNTVNTMSSFLRPNWSDAEATNTNHSIDLLSNGFKSRAVDSGVNASGGTFIYMAFSESPFKNSLAR